MTNIPTDLLRTFVLVVEQRSFTRAAKVQGMTQPAISAQIRRLQALLGVDLFDKSAPGVALTPMGQHVIESARRLLSVNDHIVQIASPNATAQLVRIGVRKDCMGEELTAMLAATRARWPNLRFAVQGAGQRRLLQYLKRTSSISWWRLCPTRRTAPRAIIGPKSSPGCAARPRRSISQPRSRWSATRIAACVIASPWRRWPRPT